MLSRFRHRFRNWLIAWAVLRIVCAASPVAAALDSSFAGLQEAGARAADAGAAAAEHGAPQGTVSGAGLAAFAATGAPFLRDGSLAGMAFVLPDQPSADAVQAYLALMGHFGRVSGRAGLRAEVVPGSQVGRMADRHLIVIGEEETQPLVTAWERHQSVRRDGRRVQVVMAGSPIGRLLRAPDADTVAAEGRGRMLARARVGAPQAWLAAFVSPLDARRLVVVLGARGGARLTHVTSDIADPATRPGVRGDYFLKTASESAFHASGRPAVRETRPLPLSDRWYAVPLGLLVLVAGFGLTLLAAVGLHRGLLFALAMVRTAERSRTPSHSATTPGPNRDGGFALREFGATSGS